MPTYLTAERLKLAVDRLRKSRASTGLINFFVLKRALALNPPDGYVGFSTKDKLLQQAIDELTIRPQVEATDDRPFVNVFGTINSKTMGTMGKKYRSNGPGDTLRNSAWNKVVETRQGDDSLGAKLTVDYRADLARLTLVKDTERAMPKLSDAAVWYHRNQDIAPFIGNALTTADIEKVLIANFCAKLNLDQADVKILFAPEATNA